MQNLPVIAVTIGDVAGVGPEVVAKALSNQTKQPPWLPLVIGNAKITQQAAQLFHGTVGFQALPARPQNRQQLSAECQAARQNNTVLCWDPFGDRVMDAPRRAVSPIAGDAAYCYLVEAIRLVRSDICHGISTAPLNKEGLHAAGHHYPGHTEILAQECGVTNFAMMLHLAESRLNPFRRLLQNTQATPSPKPEAVANHDSQTGAINLTVANSGLSIAHVTLHTSIASVPGLLTVDGIFETACLMHDFLTQIGCQRKAIAIAALNPHGGENGLFGNEEAETIRPAVQKAIAHGVNAVGPLPIDTLIRRAVLGEFDGVVAMYHDQGHIPVKLIGFDAAVNITLGLPLVRTSPTHGTAFDRAWDAATPADPAGMMEAIQVAARLCQPLAALEEQQQCPSE